MTIEIKNYHIIVTVIALTSLCIYFFEDYKRIQIAGIEVGAHSAKAVIISYLKKDEKQLSIDKIKIETIIFGERNTGFNKTSLLRTKSINELCEALRDIGYFDKINIVYSSKYLILPKDEIKDKIENLNKDNIKYDDEGKYNFYTIKKKGFKGTGCYLFNVGTERTLIYKFEEDSLISANSVDISYKMIQEKKIIKDSIIKISNLIKNDNLPIIIIGGTVKGLLYNCKKLTTKDTLIKLNQFLLQENEGSIKNLVQNNSSNQSVDLVYYENVDLISCFKLIKDLSTQIKIKSPNKEIHFQSGIETWMPGYLFDKASN